MTLERVFNMYGDSMANNSRVIVLQDEQDEQVALIWCEEGGEAFYCFPGGRLEPRETWEEAAIREAREELGIEARLDRLVATFHLTWAGNPADGEGRFYLATAVAGVFGSGDGPEYTPGLYPGVYIPRWVTVAELPSLDVRPRQIARALADGAFTPDSEVVHVHEER
jgi:8-oxo-dGTP pyrophosphatase MutT (NUDIX family)